MTAKDVLLRCLDQAYDRRSWHGPNLRGAIRGVSAAQAVWRPRADRHNIWEIVVHAAYWKYIVRRRLTGERRGSFPLAGSNWFRRSRADNAAWAADVVLLRDQHRLLRRVVETPNTARPQPNNSFALISGIVAHDLYHAGQIQLLKRLMAHRRRS
ncbi:MAG: DinB family protein [Acidobacteria bacterium]|nr:DinB family protein [Acidobacteriota bacterium]